MVVCNDPVPAPPGRGKHSGYAVKIIDAQVHIWSKTVVPTFGLHRKAQKFTAEELLKEMDEAGVDAALIHPPSWDPDSNGLSVEAAQKYPDRFAVMGQFDLFEDEDRSDYGSQLGSSYGDIQEAPIEPELLSPT